MGTSFVSSGADCSIVPTCYNVSDCTGNGICVDFDVCKCNIGWTGNNCTQYSCEQLDYCSGNVYTGSHIHSLRKDAIPIFPFFPHSFFPYVLHRSPPLLKLFPWSDSGTNVFLFFFLRAVVKNTVAARHLTNAPAIMAGPE